MNLPRKRRMYFIIFLLVGVGLAVGLALFALRKNINLYFTPSQLKQHANALNKEFRLGGLVVTHSVHRVADSLKVSFVLTDFKNTITVKYNGILPSLFREGQGIVAQGKLNAKGVFVADQVLAKHDSTYRPPGIPKGNA